MAFGYSLTIRKWQVELSKEQYGLKKEQTGLKNEIKEIEEINGSERKAIEELEKKYLELKKLIEKE